MTGFAAPRKFLYGVDVLLYILCLAGLYHAGQKGALPVERMSEGWLVIERAREGTALRAWDRLTSVAGVAVTDPDDVEFVCDGRRIGDLLRVGVVRDGTPRTVTVSLVRYYSPRYLAIQFLVGSLFFFLGVYVLIRRPSDRSALLFHWNSICIAGIIFMTWGCYAISPAGAGQLLRVAFSASYVFTPALFLHFCLRFPAAWKGALRRVVPGIYAVPILLTAAMGFTFLEATARPSFWYFHLFSSLYAVTRIFFALCMLTGLGALIVSHRRAESGADRKKIRWILFGSGVAAMGYVLLWSIPQLLHLQEILSEEAVIVMSAAAPVSIAIAIVRHGVFDIDTLITRSTVYTIVAAILLAAYAAIIGAIAIFVQRWTVELSLYLSAFAAVTVALLLDPTRRRVQEFVDRRFFRVRYNYREAMRAFSEEIGSYYDERELAAFVIRRIAELLPVERAGFFRLSRANNRLLLLAHRGFGFLEGRGVPLRMERLRSRLDLPVGLPERIEPDVPFEAEGREMLERWRIALILPFLSEQRDILGFVILGGKKSGTRYSREDVDLLQNMTTQAGLAYERLMLQQQLVLKSEEARHLEELSRMKSLFVSTVSHELRTPLTSIRMFAELMREHPDLPPDKQRQYLEIIEGESERLKRLINNILHFARIERGRQVYVPVRADVNALVEQVLASMQYQFQMSRIAVAADLHPDAGEILADPDAVAGALMNLLSNAVKYSGGSERIEVATRRGEEWISVSVRDHGIGISAEHLEPIFEPYVRATESQGVSVEGTGLGLSLVRDVMRAHGGSVEVRSAPGEGSTFVLHFPIPSAGADDAAEEGAQSI